MRTFFVDGILYQRPLSCDDGVCVRPIVMVVPNEWHDYCRDGRSCPCGQSHPISGPHVVEEVWLKIGCIVLDSDFSIEYWKNYAAALSEQ